MGYRDWRHRGLPAQGTVLPDAGGIRQGDHTGQARDEEHIRVSGLQDQNARSYVRLDVQFENPREAHQVDPGRRRDSPTDLSTPFLLRRPRLAQPTFTRDFALVIVSSSFFLCLSSHES